jgi:hypothetical protein
MGSETNLIDSVVEALRALPHVHADPPHLEAALAADEHGVPYDARVDVRIGSETFTLLIEAKRDVYPRDVREILWRIQRGLGGPAYKHLSGQLLPLIAAEAISPGAKALLRQEQVGYFDRGGSLFVPARGAYIYVDKPPPKPLAKTMRSLFTGRRAQVLHALLVHPRRWVNVKELAEQSESSPATVSQVVTELARLDWMETRGQGPVKERLLREPNALLDAWAAQLGIYSTPILRRYYVPALKLIEFTIADLPQRIDRVCEEHHVPYAITHEAAAQRYAPFLTSVAQVRCRLASGERASAALAALDAREVTEGSNLAIIEGDVSNALLFREKIGGAWLASPIQVYLDLLHSEGRAKEMAEHLRQERIGF